MHVHLLPHADHGLLLATAGDDGYVRIWRVMDILAASAASAAVDGSSTAAAAAVQPAAAVQVPHLQNSLGISDGSQPAVQALATDEKHQQLFVGECTAELHVCVVLEHLWLRVLQLFVVLQQQQQQLCQQVFRGC
jgi:hypothetical protein